MNLPNVLRCQWEWRSHPLFIVLTIAAGQFSDQFLFGMRVPLLPVLVHDHLHISDPSQAQHLVATILASFSIATLLSAIPAGWIADIRSLRGYLYLAGLGALLWSTITFYTSENFVTMVVSRALNGLSAAILYAAGYAMVADSVGPKDLGKALGTIKSLVAVGEIAGPPLGGIIFSHWGFAGILHVSLAVIFVDLVMRVLMVDKKRAPTPPSLSTSSDEEYITTEASPLLPSKPLIPADLLLPNTTTTPTSPRHSHNKPPPAPLPQTPPSTPHPPITTYLTDPQILISLLLSMTQYIILGCYDSTLPLELESPPPLGFNLAPSQVGFVYLSLAIPTLLFAPLAGWAVDKFGPRRVAIWGFGGFVPALGGMVTTTATGGGGYYGGGKMSKEVRLGLFCLGLSVQGVCLALVSTPGMVKIKRRVGELQWAWGRRINGEYGSESESDYTGWDRNRELDRAGGRYGEEEEPGSVMGQLFGLNTMVFSFGLLVGDYAGAWSRTSIGYGGMNLALAALCGIATALVSVLFTNDHRDVDESSEDSSL